MKADHPKIADPPSPAVSSVLVEVVLSAPFWRYRQLFAGEPYSFLLDSAKDDGRLGRFSFLGGDPALVYKAHRQLLAGEPARARIEVTRLKDVTGDRLPAPVVQQREGDLFDDLRGVLEEFHVEHEQQPGIELPLRAGAIGYFGYEACHFIENLPDSGRDDLALPDVYLTFHDVVLAHEHRSGRSFLSVIGRGATDEEAVENCLRQRDALLARIGTLEASQEFAGVQPRPTTTAEGAVDVRAHFDLDSYCRLVETCQEHIFAGDVFEICLTHRLDAPLACSSWELYEELRRVNPAPFAAYLQMPEAQIISSSPERFLRLDAERMAESRPIKGTRRRGATPADDQAILRELSTSEKDRAENVMIVDLVRNDLGRVCQFGTVEVPELMAIEAYATVFQMVSTVRGRLADEYDALDLLRAAFPGGSMTGAPKIEAMKIIDRLEPVKRGVYSGAIGYIDFSGTMDLSIAIRTLVAIEGRAYFGVGGAVVADSIPRAEYHETLDKARALIAALSSAQAAPAQSSGDEGGR